MQISYKSDYPNQVHQLNLSISQNHYLLKDGEIRHQQKKFDVNWKNYTNTGKRHLVNFLIRDHYSNCFYAETHPIDAMPHLIDFLFNAWKEKEDFEFCGIPKNIIVGRHIIQEYPEFKIFEENVTDFTIELANNGFATGIRSVRDWESNIPYFTFYEPYRHIVGFQTNTAKLCRELNARDNKKTEPNLKKWIENEPLLRVTNDKNEFNKLFH